MYSYFLWPPLWVSPSCSSSVSLLRPTQLTSHPNHWIYQTLYPRQANKYSIFLYMDIVYMGQRRYPQKSMSLRSTFLSNAGNKVNSNSELNTKQAEICIGPPPFFTTVLVHTPAIPIDNLFLYFSYFSPPLFFMEPFLQALVTIYTSIFHFPTCPSKNLLDIHHSPPIWT